MSYAKFGTIILTELNLSPLGIGAVSLDGGPDPTRTGNLEIPNPLLCPVELRNQPSANAQSYSSGRWHLYIRKALLLHGERGVD